MKWSVFDWHSDHECGLHTGRSFVCWRGPAWRRTVAGAVCCAVARCCLLRGFFSIYCLQVHIRGKKTAVLFSFLQQKKHRRTPYNLIQHQVNTNSGSASFEEHAELKGDGRPYGVLPIHVKSLLVNNSVKILLVASYDIKRRVKYFIPTLISEKSKNVIRRHTYQTDTNLGGNVHVVAFPM